MPKAKTNRGAAKRFRKTSNGKFKRHRSGARHLMTAKSPKRRRGLRGATLVAKSDLGRINRMLPND